MGKRNESASRYLDNARKLQKALNPDTEVDINEWADQFCTLEVLKTEPGGRPREWVVEEITHVLEWCTQGPWIKVLRLLVSDAEQFRERFETLKQIKGATESERAEVLGLSFKKKTKREKSEGK